MFLRIIAIVALVLVGVACVLYVSLSAEEIELKVCHMLKSDRRDELKLKAMKYRAIEALLAVTFSIAISAILIPCLS